MALVHPEGEKPRGDVARVDSGVAGMAGGLMGQTSLDPSKNHVGVNNSRMLPPPPNELNLLQNPRQDSAEQFGKSVAFGGQQAQQFFDRQYGKPVAPPNSNPTPVGGPLAMDPVTAVKLAEKLAPEPFETQKFDVNSGISMKGDPDPIFNNKVSDTTFIPKNFNKYRQPPGGSSDVSKFVNKGSYKVGEEIDEDDYSDLGGKLDIHNITPVQTNKGKLFVTGGRKDSNIKFFGKNIPGHNINLQKK